MKIDSGSGPLAAGVPLQVAPLHSADPGHSTHRLSTVDGNAPAQDSRTRLKMVVLTSGRGPGSEFTSQRAIVPPRNPAGGGLVRDGDGSNHRQQLLKSPGKNKVTTEEPPFVVGWGDNDELNITRPRRASSNHLPKPKPPKGPWLP